MNFLGSFYNAGIVLVGVTLLGAAAGTIGCFAVLRRRALTGDALAHAALPGLCLGFLVGGDDLAVLLTGALVSGLAGIAVITALRHWTRIKEDAAIGIVLSVFFGAGIVLLSVLPGRAGLETFILGKTAGMGRQDVMLIAGLALVTLVVVVLLYKEFKLVSFDPEFARVQGWPGFLLDFALMLLIVLAVVIGLPAVGVLMMAALLVTPAAAARFWTERLGVMLLLSAFIGMVSGATGAVITSSFEIPAGPTIVLAAATLFLVSLLFAPRRGLVARLVQQAQNQREMHRRQFLTALHEILEPGLPLNAVVPLEKLAGLRTWSRRRLHRLIADAASENDLVREGDCVVLTPQGLEKAAAAARTQRLWRLYLREHPENAPALLTIDLAPLEDILPEALVEELELKLRADKN